MMLSVFLSSLLVNLTPEPRSAAAGSRWSVRFFFGFGSEATAYKARGATIEGVPAMPVSPEIAVLKPLAVIAGYAATGVEAASSPKYTSSGVRYSRD